MIKSVTTMTDKTGLEHVYEYYTVPSVEAVIADLYTQLSAATAALEAAQKDAERFQWWFGVGNDERVSGLVRAEMVRVDDPEAETVLLTLDQWREAIDAARREGGGES